MRNSSIGAHYSGGNKKRFLIWAALALLAVAILAVLSPLCPKSTIISYTDSSVFQYIGSSMLDGVMPYRDVFDHKGPLIYLINGLGWLLHGESGIWLIEIVSFAACSILWFELAYLVNHSAPASLFASILGMSAFVLWIEGGNLTEEYCLPFLTVVLYIYAAVIRSRKPISACLALLTGVSCAAIFLVKYNALLFVIPLVICELVKLHRDGAPLFKYVCSGFIGFALPTIAAVVWLFSNDALMACFRDYFLFNMSYAGSANLIDRFVSLSAFANCSAVIVSFSLLSIASFSRLLGSRRAIFLSRGAFVSFLIGFVTTAGTGYTFGHYALFFTPFIALSFSMVPRLLRSYEHPIQKLVFSTIVVLMLVLFVCPSLESSLSLTKQSADSAESQSTLIQQVTSRTNQGDKIGIVGNACWVYLHSGTVAASSVGYVPAGIADYASWFNAMHDDYEEAGAKIVLVSNQFTDIFCNESFLQQYQCVSETYGFKVYELRF